MEYDGDGYQQSEWDQPSQSTSQQQQQQQSSDHESDSDYKDSTENGMGVSKHPPQPASRQQPVTL